MNPFSDPAKLIPTIIAIGAVVCLALGKINPKEMLMILGANQAIHGGISALNNSNAPDIPTPKKVI